MQTRRARGRDPADVEAALENLAPTLQLVRPSFADIELVHRRDADGKQTGRLLSDILLERLAGRKQDSVFLTSAVAAGVFRAMIDSVANLARTDTELLPYFEAVRFDLIMSAFAKLEDKAERRHREVMAAINREKGVPLRALKELFVSIGREMPDASDAKLEELVRAAVNELLARAASPAEIGNDPEAIRIAIQIARNKLGSADADGAVEHLLAAEAEQAELLVAQARAAARLPRERAQILKMIYRWDEAIVAFEAAAALDASNPWDHFEIGEIRQSRGNLVGAKAAFERGKAVAEDTGQESNVSAAHSRTGEILLAEGKLPEARASFEASLAIAEKLAGSDPGHAGWQHDLSVSHEKIGDVFVAEGKLPDARVRYEASLAIFEKLVGSDPGHAGWQRALSVSHSKIGHVFFAEGKLPEARASFEASLAIAEKLAGSDPGHAGWQRDLSVSHEKIGDVFVAEGKLPDARGSYEASLAIAEKLAGSDPGNAGWQRDLSVSHSKIGTVFFAEGKLPDARGSYEASLAIAEKLAGSDPSNAGWQRDLSISHSKIGDVSVAEGKLPEARENYEASLAIDEKLAGSDPGHAGWQRDLIVSNVKLAQTRAAPCGNYRQALHIAQSLHSEGKLAPRDAWMIDALKQLLAENDCPDDPA